ncbi:tetratricopeptide repeat protein [Sorangium sp. So ce1151]|uniref:tetratricopeptide repeat protein n=1 Tax=Sorangium sp. So ce1151 TaxID=3133332 RepID=UPI003F634D1B
MAPEDVETLVALAAAHLARGRVDDAERWARAALEAKPEHADALVLVRHVLLRRGDMSGARARGLSAPHRRERSGRAEAPRRHQGAQELAPWPWFRVSSVLAGSVRARCSSSSPRMSPQDPPLR